MAHDEEKLLKTVDKQSKEIARLTARVVELERMLKLDSTNSSRPPSSDGLKRKNKKPRTQSLRKKSRKKSGGQKGHKGQTLEQTCDPDYIIDHTAECCEACDTKFSAAETSILSGKRQVFDIAKPKIEVTEHRIFSCLCDSCGHVTKASFPQDVNAATQYGERIQNIVVYLQNYQFLPEDRLAETMKNLFSVSLTTGTVANICCRTAERLKAIVGKIKNAIATGAKVKHLDETGFRIGGKTNWLHVASTKKLTHYRVAGRGDMLENLTGIIVHDHWKSYYTIAGVDHVLCNAHHLRELMAVEKLDGDKWAAKISAILLEMLKMTHNHADCSEKSDAKAEREIILLYDKVLAKAISDYEKLPPLIGKTGKKSRAKRKGHNLALRLQNFKHDVLRFWYDPDVPFTNNLAESDIRMMKLRQKISGGFRTQQGAENFALIRSFISSARKQKLNIMTALQNPKMLEI